MDKIDKLTQKIDLLIEEIRKDRGFILCYQCSFYNKLIDVCFVNPTMKYQSPRFRQCLVYKKEDEVK